MRIVADESVDFGIIENLRKNQFEVYSILESNPSILDSVVLDIANQQKAILLTEDKDFGELVYRLKLYHKGILLIRLSDLLRESRVNVVTDVLIEHFAKLEGKFSVLNKRGLRIK